MLYPSYAVIKSSVKDGWWAQVFLHPLHARSVMLLLTSGCQWLHYSSPSFIQWRACTLWSSSLESDVLCCCHWDFRWSTSCLLCKFWLPSSCLTHSRIVFFSCLSCHYKSHGLYAKSVEFCDKSVLQARCMLCIHLHSPLHSFKIAFARIFSFKVPTMNQICDAWIPFRALE